MALEKSWEQVSQLFTSNGTTNGIIAVTDASGFFAKQKVTLSSNTQPKQEYEVKRVLPGKVIVGLCGTSIVSYTDVSAYTLADAAVIFAAEQNKKQIQPPEIWNAVYERDPAVAIRTKLVDIFGTSIGPNNPLPVQFSAAFPDIVKITDGNGSGDNLVVNPDGSINVVTSATATAQTPTTVNFPILLANTEYSYVFPTGTRQFSIKDRDGYAKTRIAYIVGGTSASYQTIDMGCTLPVSDILTTAGFTVYFQSNKAGRILEIVSWK